MDWSILESNAPKQEEKAPEPVKETGLANVSIRVDADADVLCDQEYVGELKAGMMLKVQLPTGQHLLEFLSRENPNVKVEKQVEWPESDKNYLVIVNELKARIAPPVNQMQQPQMPPQNAYLDQLNQMARMNPLAGMNYGMPQMPTSMPQMPTSMPQMPSSMPQMPAMPTDNNNNNNNR